MYQSPALALRNVGLSPTSLMAAINRMDRKRPDIIPQLDLPPPASCSCQKQLSEFPKLSELPVELRLKIWGFACFIQRDISIRVKSLGALGVRRYTTSDSIRHEIFDSHEFITTTANPAILHTCQDSRAVGLVHYRLSFGTSYEFMNLKITTPSSIYVNWDCDRICVLWPPEFHSHKSPSFKTFVKICQENKLRCLALNVLRDYHWAYVDITTTIRSLEEVLLFGSNVFDIDLVPKANFSNIGFITMEKLAAEHPVLWDEMRNHPWATRLEVPKRDLATFFQLTMHRIEERPKFLESHEPSWMDPAAPAILPVSVFLEEYDKDHEELSLWQPPRIETAYITVNGVPESSSWDW